MFTTIWLRAFESSNLNWHFSYLLWLHISSQKKVTAGWSFGKTRFLRFRGGGLSWKNNIILVVSQAESFNFWKILMLKKDANMRIITMNLGMEILHFIEQKRLTEKKPAEWKKTAGFQPAFFPDGFFFKSAGFFWKKPAGFSAGWKSRLKKNHVKFWRNGRKSDVVKEGVLLWPALCRYQSGPSTPYAAQCAKPSPALRLSFQK